MTSSCSVADAAAAPSFASARRREAADRAQTATTALLDLRSVSQWVRRVYQPELRRETDRSLSSPATAVCIPHLCESRPHAARCACEVHGMKCGWCACDCHALALPVATAARSSTAYARELLPRKKKSNLNPNETAQGHTMGARPRASSCRSATRNAAVRGRVENL